MTQTRWRWFSAVICIVAVGWIWQLPQHLTGADALADLVARLQVKSRVARERIHDPDEGVEHWISDNPEAFAKERDELARRFRDGLSLQTPDGTTHPYLADYDSYAWVRAARNYLEHGTTCDEVRGGRCRDTYVNPPLGADMLYNRSLHIAGIIGLHRLITLFSPDYPLTSTASWVPWIGAVLGVIAAFALGSRLGGTIGGMVAALLTFLNPLVVQRSLGSDNDIWNVTLPLYLAWMIIAAFDVGSWLRSACLFASIALLSGLHAVTWSGWILHVGILVCGALLFVLHEAARCQSRDPVALRRHAWALLLVTLAIGAGVCALSGVEATVATFERALANALPQPGEPPQAAATSGVWPSIFATVSELASSSFRQIATQTFGIVWMWMALMGLPLGVLPRRLWWRWPVLLLAGSTGLVTWACYRSLIGSNVLVSSLLGLAVLALAWRRRVAVRSDDGLGPGEFIVALWLLATVKLAVSGARYGELAAAPLALSTAILIGRGAANLGDAAPVGFRRRYLVEPVLCVLATVLLLQPISVGYDIASSFIPAMNDAWWKVLEYTRDNSGPTAIVNTWWDFGYWVKYVARRPTTADGAMLRSHLPYWLGRILVSSHPLEATGLLRMINCKGDDTPYDEGQQSAYGLIQAILDDAVRAQELIVTLASQSRTDAAKTLDAYGFTPEQQQAVLAATHCEPSESYLLLGTEMTRRDSWVRIGQWDFRKAYIRDAIDRHVAADVVAADVAKRFAFTDGTARSLVADATHLSKTDFISGYSPRAPSSWYPCRSGSSAGTLRCPLGLQDKATNRIIDEFSFSIAAPETSRLKVRRSGDKEPVLMKPAALRVAASGLDDIRLEGDIYPDAGVLVDYAAKRVLIGSPTFLRSLYVQLVYLEGRYTTGLFEKVIEEVSVSDDRVSLWRIHYPADPVP